MTPYDFVQLALLACGGEIKGSTKLQKTMYFLGLLTGFIDDLDYQPHLYGPHSFEVADAISTLQGIGFASSSVGSMGSVDPQGFEIRRFDYHLTEEGRRAAERKARTYPELWQKLQEGVEHLRLAGNLEYVPLSIAAKASFLVRQRLAAADDQELAKVFGWPVALEQIRAGLEYLRRLNLTSRVPA